MKAKLPEVYVPLWLVPGEAAQVDLGEAMVLIAGKQTELNLFCMRLCHSCAPFVMAFPSQREEVFLEGHQRAFEYFQGVPKRIIYDNLKTAVKEGWGKHAKEQDRFKAFRSHYAYEAMFCNTGEVHEKGLIENLVGYIRRNVLVPIPKVQSWEELDQLLLNAAKTTAKTTTSADVNFRLKKPTPLNKHPLRHCPFNPLKLSKWQT